MLDCNEKHNLVIVYFAAGMKVTNQRFESIVGKFWLPETTDQYVFVIFIIIVFFILNLAKNVTVEQNHTERR